MKSARSGSAGAPSRGSPAAEVREEAGFNLPTPFFFFFFFFCRPGLCCVDRGPRRPCGAGRDARRAAPCGHRCARLGRGRHHGCVPPLARDVRTHRVPHHRTRRAPCGFLSLIGLVVARLRRHPLANPRRGIGRALSDGAIVMLHAAAEHDDFEPASVRALPRLVALLDDRGLTSVGLDTLLATDGPCDACRAHPACRAAIRANRPSQGSASEGASCAEAFTARAAVFMWRPPGELVRFKSEAAVTIQQRATHLQRATSPRHRARRSRLGRGRTHRRAQLPGRDSAGRSWDVHAVRSQRALSVSSKALHGAPVGSKRSAKAVLLT